MMEFQEVMYHIDRMCRQERCDYGFCPLYDVCGNIGNIAEKTTAERIEKIVTQWAAEHPEPVYETWFEYLLRIGVIPVNAPAGGEYQWIVESIKHKHISNDIAESLKLHPKEVQA